MKKRNTQINLRLPRGVVVLLEERAKGKGYDSVTAYIKSWLLKETGYETPIESPVEPPIEPFNPVLPSEPVMKLPTYDWRVQTGGERVRVWDGKEWQEAIAPILDEHGQVVK